ncbi:1-acyl-sn-glycerol-3-phosphate acyltransferase [Alphaproteobacteria bacterium]|nr:1-acyl-sn-glycerol-3-phosphate acyltransferase [Alphaproteobacteria bacterium]
MIFLRSLLYQMAFLPWTLALGILYLPLLAAPRTWMQKGAALWVSGALFLQRVVLGLSFECRGMEHLPKGACIIASKHQSAWETMIFHTLLSDPAFILKRELLLLPFVGWYMWKSGQIAVDRRGAAAALRKMTSLAQRAAMEGRQIIIFPEGHRQSPGETGVFHPGVAMLSATIGAPVIPVVLNSGLFWGRNAFLRRPGRIVIEFMPAIAARQDRKAFMSQLRAKIEAGTASLEKEARDRHL